MTITDRFPTGSPTGSPGPRGPEWFPVPHPYGNRNHSDRFPKRFPNTGTTHRHHHPERHTMSTLLAIDPGNTESGWVVIDTDTRRPIRFGKTPNEELLGRLWTASSYVIEANYNVIEMIASYGMAVGAEVFDTCVWIGRFYTAIECHTGDEPQLVKRHPVKLHHCHSSKATDSNITQALVDRFAYGQTNHGKGTKAAPGWFYGFKADIWQAYALAVYAADQLPPIDTAPVGAPIEEAAS